MKTATHLLKTSQNYCACATYKRLSTRYQTRLNVTKCHACHAKQSNATFETSKILQNSPQAGPYSSDLARTVANSCERFRTVANSCAPSREHTLNPQTPSETGTLATHSGKNTGIYNVGILQNTIDLIICYCLTIVVMGSSFSKTTTVISPSRHVGFISDWFISYYTNTNVHVYVI